MSDIRYYAETPCEKCGETHTDHWVWDHDEQRKCRGSGGSRVEVKPIQPDYRTAAIELVGADPPEGLPPEFKWSDVIEVVIEQTVQPVVDAVLAGGVLVEVDDG